jgi:hypothetical protein
MANIDPVVLCDPQLLALIYVMTILGGSVGP